MRLMIFGCSICMYQDSGYIHIFESTQNCIHPSMPFEAIPYSESFLSGRLFKELENWKIDGNVFKITIETSATGDTLLEKNLLIYLTRMSRNKESYTYLWNQLNLHSVYAFNQVGIFSLIRCFSYILNRMSESYKIVRNPTDGATKFWQNVRI